jgi:cytoplasmic iron level regulating protein YaaA (DUF328/UPF0246 family)
MKIVISPAKTLDFESKIPIDRQSTCIFLEEAERLNRVLRKKSPRSLTRLMNISPQLSELNWERNQDWSLPFTEEKARQAIYAFRGEVYLGIDALTIPEESADQLQDKLRILSGQYGILKPFDMIMPYRLEMGTRLRVNTRKNLYEFWGSKITKALNEELKDDGLLINLASNEYFKVLKKKELNAQIITPVFKDFKNGTYKSIMTFAKRARGLMVRYIVDNDVNSIDELKLFNERGYAFDSSMSTPTELVFTR